MKGDDPEVVPFATKMIETPKIVFSRTLTMSPWEHTTIASGSLTEEIARLKAAPGGDIIAYGGARFAGDLISKGLIDEYHLFVNPTAIGGGLSMFGQPGTLTPLNLVSATGFDCGVVELFYTPKD
jgi:dihydrofolate reductase